MSESLGHEHEVNPDWQEVIETGIQDAFDNFELFYMPSRDEVIGPLSFSPVSLTMGEDDRMFPDLSPAEQGVIMRSFFSHLQMDENPETVGTYGYTAPVPDPESEHTQGWEGEASVTVLRTGLSESEGKFLHKVVYPDGKTDYAVASEEYRL